MLCWCSNQCPLRADCGPTRAGWEARIPTHSGRSRTECDGVDPRGSERWSPLTADAQLVGAYGAFPPACLDSQWSPSVNGRLGPEFCRIGGAEGERRYGKRMVQAVTWRREGGICSVRGAETSPTRQAEVAAGSDGGRLVSHATSSARLVRIRLLRCPVLSPAS